MFYRNIYDRRNSRLPCAVCSSTSQRDIA